MYIAVYILLKIIYFSVRKKNVKERGHQGTIEIKKSSEASAHAA